MKNRQYVSRHEHTKHLTESDIQKNVDGVYEFTNPTYWNTYTFEYFRNKHDDSL
jgi:hypothetical protein